MATKLKIVFAVVSQGKDYYSAMTRVAIASLRVSNPNCWIILACDTESDQVMRGRCDPIIDEVDEWHVMAAPKASALFRSRYVKTSLRDLIDGPFLSLDSDIFVRRELDFLFSLDCDIAGARNHSRRLLAEQVWESDRLTLEAMGWPIGNEAYINTGVIFYNHTEGAVKFAAEWHRKWLQAYSSLGRHQDQPAFNSALYTKQPRLTLLSDNYNAQIITNPKVAYDATIWHYYSSVNRPAMTCFEILTHKVFQGTSIDYDLIRDMVNTRHPWRCENIIDAWAVKSLGWRGSCAGWEVAWLRRKMREYIGNKLSKVLVKSKRTAHVC